LNTGLLLLCYSFVESENRLVINIPNLVKKTFSPIIIRVKELNEPQPEGNVHWNRHSLPFPIFKLVVKVTVVEIRG